MNNDEKKLQVKLFRIAVTATGLSLIVLFFGAIVMRNWLVVGFGIRTFRSVRAICTSLVALCLGCTVSLSVPLVKLRLRHRRGQKLEQERQEEYSQTVTNYAKDSTNPESTRRMLKQLWSEMPELEEIVQQCLRQMDRMDILQRKQNTLIETNEALSLKETLNVLDNVEYRMYCRNFRNIINYCIVADDYGQIDLQKVNQNLEDNEKKLSDAKKLIDASVDWINQYNEDHIDNRSEVESWIAIISESLRED